MLDLRAAALPAAMLFGLFLLPATANELDVPITEQASEDGQLPTCMSSRVKGLNPDGDGFLAVRSGPGTQYRKLDDLHNDDIVYEYERRGEWAGIVYRTQNVSCNASQTRIVPHGNRGWVHTNWLADLAG